MIISILLTILKILGIILAGILGLVLFLLIIILFVPIRYKAFFERSGLENDPPIIAGARVSWLLHAVHISFDYPSDKGLVIRIFSIPLKSKSNKSDKSKAKERERKKEKKKILDQDQNIEKDCGQDIENDCSRNTENDINCNKNREIETDNNPCIKLNSDIHDDDNLTPNINANEAIANSADNRTEIISDNKTDSNTDNNTDSNTDNNTDSNTDSNTDCNSDNNADNNADDNADKTSLFKRIKESYDSITYTLKHGYDIVKSALTGSVDKVEDIKKNINYYYKILTSDLFERTFEKAKHKLYKLLKSILPKYINIEMEVGFDDPATTGQVLAIYATLIPVLWKSVHIYGNFDENIIRGHGKLRGRIYVFSLLVIAIYYFTDKDMKKLLRLLKKEEKKNGRKQ